ncbi:MAG TPA: hypothetical protein DCG34_13660 [Clostridiales bacterium]|nr:hypothetical protein [Clostridiales bacterium]
MNHSDTHNVFKTLKLLVVSFVSIFGLFIMIIPIIKTMSSSGTTTDGLISGMAISILTFLFLPNIIYCIVAVKTKKLEYLLLPALALLGAEYYFFHNYQTWIASDANAAIALVIIPIYLMIVLGISYAISFLVVKMRSIKH